MFFILLPLTVLSCTAHAIETHYERDIRVSDGCGTDSVPCEDWPFVGAGKSTLHLKRKHHVNSGLFSVFAYTTLCGPCILTLHSTSQFSLKQIDVRHVYVAIL